MPLSSAKGAGEGDRPRLLVTGFGPFPGASENPTEALVHALANRPAENFGASTFRAVVLPTDYRRSWSRLRRLYATFNPDVVVHFGLSIRAECIHVETVARNCAAPDRPDAAGFAPRSGRAATRSGAEILPATLPVEAIVGALNRAGIPAVASDEAGAYVCNATLYRSLAAAPPTRRVGFIHVPPERSAFARAKALEAAQIVLLTVVGGCSATALAGDLVDSREGPGGSRLSAADRGA